MSCGLSARIFSHAQITVSICGVAFMLTTLYIPCSTCLATRRIITLMSQLYCFPKGMKLLPGPT